MKITTDLRQGTAILRLEGDFTFAHHAEFKEAAYPLLATPGVTALHLDLSAVTHMDSSSLGMLLVLHQKAKDANQTVCLVNPSPKATLILQAVQFGRLFTVLES